MKEVTFKYGSREKGWKYYTCIEERISNNEKLPKPTFQIDDNKDDIPVLMSCKCNTNKVVA
ncbi:MAG: hypothetical protein J6M39_01100 [Lachnospiraceae bacterium]|nr:hypothetical protein [Lachnospiraceae bacterium]